MTQTRRSFATKSACWNSPSNSDLPLMEISRRTPILETRWARDEMAVVELAIEHPTGCGPARVAAELRQRALSISPFGARCVWQRRDLENMRKCLRPLEARMLRHGTVLTDAKRVA